MKTCRLIKFPLTIAICSTLLMGQTAHARENEVWISPNGTANTTASGTPNDPFRCPDAASLNTVLTSVLTGGNLTIHFMNGQFLVGSNGIVMRTGWKLRGAGIDNTILQLQTNALPGIGVAVIGGTASLPQTDGAEVSDMTVDCNYHHQTSPRHY